MTTSQILLSLAVLLGGAGLAGFFEWLRVRRLVAESRSASGQPAPPPGFSRVEFEAKSDDLERANASIKTGARLTQVGVPIFGLFGLLVLTGVALGPWQDLVGRVLLVASILIVAAATTVIVVQARRLSRFQLRADGVQAANGWTLPWNAITRAAYFNGWVSLYDGAGRGIEMPIMFAISKAKVLSAIRGRLPGGVQIEHAPSPHPRPN